VRVREEKRAEGADAPKPPRIETISNRKPVAQESPKAAQRKSAGPSKNRVREQGRAEREVEAAEAALKALEDELADPAAWATKYEAAKSEARHTAAKRAVEAAYERLETLID
jgi:hypothetical protein